MLVFVGRLLGGLGLGGTIIAPPSYTPALHFNDARNSMYLTIF